MKPSERIAARARQNALAEQWSRDRRRDWIILALLVVVMVGAVTALIVALVEGPS